MHPVTKDATYTRVLSNGTWGDVVYLATVGGHTAAIVPPRDSGIGSAYYQAAIALSDAGLISPLDFTPVTEPLESVKQRTIDAIDGKTAEIMSQGFVFEEVRFSLSLAAQNNWNTIDQRADTLPYPFPVSTKEGGEFILQSATHAKELATQALGAVVATLNAGRSLRTQVLNAVSIAEVEAVEDNRV